MDFKQCSQCGKEVEGNGVLFRDKVFCSDECCDEFEEDVSTKDVPSMKDLEEENCEDESQDNLGYRGDDDLDDGLDDDDFNIQEDDF